MSKQEKNLEGMTTNERLFATGLLDRFDKAVAQRDRDAIIAILEQVKVDTPSLERTLEQLGIK